MKLRVIPTILLSAILLAVVWGYLKIDKTTKNVVSGVETPNPMAAAHVEPENELFDWETTFDRWIADVQRRRAEGDPTAPERARWFRADVPKDLIERIELSAEPLITTRVPGDEVVITSVDAALNRFFDHGMVGVGSVSVIFFESDRFFGMSGGLGVRLVYDFSSGILVSKSDGSVYTWTMIKPRGEG